MNDAAKEISVKLDPVYTSIVEQIEELKKQGEQKK